MKPKKEKKFDVIRCKGISGIYKDKDIVVEIGEDWRTSNVFINGERINKVQSVHIHIEVGQITTMNIFKYKEKK